MDKINPATPTVNVTDAGGTYNQSQFTATTTVAGVDGAFGPGLEGATLSLAYYTGSTATGTPLGGAPTLPGTYTVKASFAGSTGTRGRRHGHVHHQHANHLDQWAHHPGVPGQPLTYTFAVSGPTQGIDFNINYGDGTTLTTGAGGPSIRLDHIYTGKGSPTIQVTATDKNGVVSTNASIAVAVTAVKMEADVVNPTLTDLAVGGTTSNDTIILSPADAAGDINVNVNGTSLGNFKPSGRILVYGQAGNDVIQLASQKTKGTTYYITAPALIYGGGTGNEDLSAAGSTANNVIIGGGGKNQITGGLGHDLLIAGLGKSTLTAGSGDDILIGGQTDYDLTSTAMTYDRKLQALDAIMAEWGRTSVNYGTPPRPSARHPERRPERLVLSQCQHCPFQRRSRHADRIKGGAGLVLHRRPGYGEEQAKRAGGHQAVSRPAPTNLHPDGGPAGTLAGPGNLRLLGLEVEYGG